MNPEREAMMNRGGAPRDRDSDYGRNHNRDRDSHSHSHSSRHRSYRERDHSDDTRTSDRYGRDRRPRDDKDRRREQSPGRRDGGSGGGRARQFMTEDEQSRQFVANEDSFVLTQAKKKADIRVRGGRAQAIDYLAFPLRYVEPEWEDFDEDAGDILISVPSALEVLESVAQKGVEALQTLKDEISAYQSLEKFSISAEYWKSLLALTKAKLETLRGRDESRVVESVKSDIDKILGPKTYEQLETLEGQIRSKLDGDDEDIDVDYWEQLLASLLQWKAKATVDRVTKAIRTKRAELVRPVDAELADLVEKGEDYIAPTSRKSASRALTKRPTPAASSSSTAPPPGTARFAQDGPEDFSAATKALYDREVARGIRDDEEIFTAEEDVTDPSSAIWSGKYRPRKPRYFNRVQMGYEWNKYNQTHYDHDNPPPKVVQGYKFNIFYPDLIDKTKAPTFKIIREKNKSVKQDVSSSTAPGENDTCLLRFIAGPPYEDIAFRIVDREWDYSSKRERGYRSSFDNGILQLHFQFKRIFYRK